MLKKAGQVMMAVMMLMGWVALFYFVTGIMRGDGPEWGLLSMNLAITCTYLLMVHDIRQQRKEAKNDSPAC